MAEPRPSGMPHFAGVKGSYYYALPLKPPFTITNLSTRLYSLRARLAVVQDFLDNYLNTLPKELGRFRAFSPYVQLMIMDYGGLALEVANLGWFSQQEIMFGIPVEWYKVVDGRWAFYDWAVIPAFIFVDDDLSLPMGRTVVGWPKTKVHVGRRASRLDRDPRAPELETVLSANVFPELYAGKRLEHRDFLEIERQPPFALGLPPDTQSSFMPWTMWSRMVESAVDLSRDSLQWMSGLGLMPLGPGTSPENAVAMMAKASEMMNPLEPRLNAKVINLKQFRASEEPSDYCYQAVTVGGMRFTRFNGFSLLGQEALMAGDLSGGYRVRLYEWPSLPIVRSLGLEVDRRWRGDGVDVAELKPVMPYWYDVDMEYSLGYDLAWRTHDGIWHGNDGKQYPPSAEEGETAYLYNTTLGPATRPLAGPFRFTGTTIRVMPLLAFHETLQTFLDGYLNRQLETGIDGKGTARERFRVWGSDDESYPFAYVYLTASSFTNVTSGTNNVGDAANRELEFLIPVRRERHVGVDDDGDDVWELVGVGVIPPFTYTDDVTAAISSSEVLGIPASGATFYESESTWMSEEGPAVDAEQPLLTVEAEVLPAMGEGSRAVVRPIVRITSGMTEKDRNELFWRNLGDAWAEIVRDEVARKKKLHASDPEDMRRMRALALEVLGDQIPISVYTLKQFRSNSDPDKACYQSLVRIERSLAEVVDLREIEEPMTIQMHDYPTRSLVSTLGLVAQPITGDKLGIVYGLKPIRPFWIRVTMDEALGQREMFRANSTEWEKGHPRRFEEKKSYFDSPESMRVGPHACVQQDQGDPRRLAKAAADWKNDEEQRHEDDRSRISEEQAAQALAKVDPQSVIESILSREWGNWDPDNRWRVGRRRLSERYIMTLSGARGDLIPSAEKQFFEDILHQARHRPGVIPTDEHEGELLEQLCKFTTQRVALQEAWGTLVSRGLEELYPSTRGDEQSRAAEVDSEDVPLPKPGRTKGDIVKAMRKLLCAIKQIAELPIYGSPSSPDREHDPSAHDNLASLQHLVGHVVDPLLEKIQGTDADEAGKKKFDEADDDAAYEEVKRMVTTHRHQLRQVQALAWDRCVLQREAVLTYAAKGYQKPDYCVRRDLAGPEHERLFPLSESWDDTWYVGPPAG